MIAGAWAGATVHNRHITTSYNHIGNDLDGPVEILWRYPGTFTFDEEWPSNEDDEGIEPQDVQIGTLCSVLLFSVLAAAVTHTQHVQSVCLIHVDHGQPSILDETLTIIHAHTHTHTHLLLKTHRG